MYIEIFGRPNCEWCEKAKELCIEKGVFYNYINVYRWGKEEFLAWKAINAPEWNTFPMVFVDEKLIGGFNELEKYFEPR